MGERVYWTIGDLAQALAASPPVLAGEITLSFPPGAASDSAMVLAMHEAGDLEIVLGVVGLEIQASVALVPVAEIRDAALFDRQLLRANKLLPLSTFGITTIAGTDVYEIFGQMSGASRLEEVLEEIDTLARNAIDAARMIEAWKAAPAAVS